MTQKSRIFVASLLPYLSALSLAACAEDSSGSGMDTEGVTSVGSAGGSGSGTGNATTGSSATGTDGSNTGGSNTGGSNTGGSNTSTGDSNTSTGGSNTSTGGSNTGGADTTMGGAAGGAGGMTDGAGGTAGGSDDMMPGAGGTAGTDDMMAGAGGATGEPDDDGAGAGAGGEGTDLDAGGVDDDPGGEEQPQVDGVHVQLDNTRQPIRGFGINTALMPGGSLPYDDLFTTEGPNAVGMSILRVGMNSNGSLTGQGISEARARGAIVIGSTWSPPANCKTNGSTQNGGHLEESCYDSWATTIANFAQQQNLYAMSIANESDFASCPGTPVCTVAYDTTVYTAKQMVEWVKVAGPKLRDVGVKVIAPEASEWTHVWSNLSGTGSLIASHPQSSDPLDCGCYDNVISLDAEAECAQHCKDGDGYDYGHWLWNDQEAWNAFDIMGVHEYDAQIAYAWPDDVNGGVRDKEVWQTEMSGVMHWPEQGPSTNIDNGVAVAGWIHSAMTVGEASAWLYWWYEAYYENDNEGLALIQGSNTIAKRYFTFGNYSKFVRPGFHAVEVAGDEDPNVLLSAYTGEEGQVVVVAINKGDAAADFSITMTGGTAPASMTPHVTSASENLVAGTAVPVTDGVFTASLSPKTVTSFVGE